MRRARKEITDREQIDDIITRSDVCRIAASVNNVPYIVPVSFGYDGQNFYFHTAPEGRKNDYWKKNNVVCFEFDIDTKTIRHETIACRWTTEFKSVIGSGKIFEIQKEEEKIFALNQIMKHYSGKTWEFSSNDMKGVKLWKLIIEEISGKKSDSF